MSVETTLATIAEQIRQLTTKVDEAAEQRSEDRKRLDAIETRLKAVEAATDYGLWEWLQHHWKIVAALSIPAPFVFSAFLAGVWQMQGDHIMDFVREEIEQSAGRASTKVLHQPEALSFVRSSGPIHPGGSLTYVLVAQRTEFGARCVYQGTVPVFIDELGRSFTTPFRSRGRQYDTNLTRAEITVPVPRGLSPGRVILQLQITYDCDGEVITERTYPVAFELLPSTEESP